MIWHGCNETNRLDLFGSNSAPLPPSRKRPFKGYFWPPILPYKCRSSTWKYIFVRSENILKKRTNRWIKLRKELFISNCAPQEIHICIFVIKTQTGFIHFIPNTEFCRENPKKSRYENQEVVNIVACLHHFQKTQPFFLVVIIVISPNWWMYVDVWKH